MTTHKEALTLALEMVQNKMYAHAEMYLKEALAQPEQEPVAWMCHPFGDDECEFSDHQECENCIPLYTTPQPHREWVGLTDEDLAVCGDEDDVLLARYWERVCKEKNT